MYNIAQIALNIYMIYGLVALVSFPYNIFGINLVPPFFFVQWLADEKKGVGFTTPSFCVRYLGFRGQKSGRFRVEVTPLSRPHTHTIGPSNVSCNHLTPNRKTRNRVLFS